MGQGYEGALVQTTYRPSLVAVSICGRGEFKGEVNLKEDGCIERHLEFLSFIRGGWVAFVGRRWTAGEVVLPLLFQNEDSSTSLL